MSTAVFQKIRRYKLHANRNFHALMRPIRNKHQRDYGLIDVAFHNNFEIHVSNSLNRDNQRLNKDKLPYFDDIIMQ